MVTVTPSTTFDNVGELLSRLGNIPPERVRMKPAPGTANEQDVLAAKAAPQKRLCELIDGVLVEKAMGFAEAVLASFLLKRLGAFVDSRDLGFVVGADGMVKLWPGRVRIPDCAFYDWERLRGANSAKEPIPDLSPDLAVEVLSTSNTDAEMRLKRDDYFASGTRRVWEVDPRKRLVSVFSNAVTPDQVLGESEILLGDEALAGFELPLTELFAVLDRLGNL